MKKINVALIGYGMSGRTFHLPPIVRNNNYEIKMVMTRNPKNQEDLISEYPGIQIITSFDEAVNNKEIDLVVIATANLVHYEYTKKTLENGKHVVCEKPFVKTYAEAKELFDLANKNN
ncbi:MAG: Gfo/Idh/MocA family oxidoreductase [Acholeplasma sp.]|nr:Gfo/Idh/MocA family oxidoreductase [Acholeplasma sp.]